MLYIFSGERRNTSLVECLRRLKTDRVHFEVDEIDVIHGSDHDLSVEGNQEKWLKRVADGEYEVVCCTPSVFNLFSGSHGQHARSPSNQKQRVPLWFPMVDWAPPPSG